MRNATLFCSIAIVLLASLFGNTTLAQEKNAASPDDMMKKWMEASTPGAAHKRLDDLVGTWTTDSRMWMQGPGSEPTTTKGTAEYKWAIGGRFLQEDFKGEMMGMPFTGLGYTGYDNFNKKYVGFWIDNTSTAMFTMEGTADPTGKIITMYGKMDDPTTGEHGKSVKYVFHIMGKDKHQFEVYDLSLAEPNTKVMEMTYTRKK